MKYLDGIKTPFPLDRIKKHIKIIYYKPLVIDMYYELDGKIEKYFFKNIGNYNNLKWIDGQPYELIILNRSKD